MDNGAESYRRYLQGDGHALEELVRTYGDGLYRYALYYVKNAQTAEDITEDVFVTLIVKRKKFAENAPFKAYLYRIARNKCYDRLRSKTRLEQPLDDYENMLKSDPERQIDEREQSERLSACMRELPPQYRDVLRLVYIEGFTQEETRTILGKSRKQLYNLLERAKRSLKTILEKEGISHEL